MHPFYVPCSDPDKIDVNVRCLDGVDLSKFKPNSFDSKTGNRLRPARCRRDDAMIAVPLDGEIRDGRHVLTMRV